jgi:hypothetical protein
VSASFLRFASRILWMPSSAWWVVSGWRAASAASVRPRLSLSVPRCGRSCGRDGRLAAVVGRQMVAVIRERVGQVQLLHVGAIGIVQIA